MRFTVGIPAFKGKYFRECIKSVLCQSYKEFELVIVNDASPDNLDSIIQEFKDERIRYYSNSKNIGAEFVVENWNKCLEKAKGEFFLLLGDDDVLESNFLEEINHLIKKYNELNVFHCRTRIINENSESVCLTPSMPEFETVYDNIWHRIKGYRVQFISDFVFRTSALKINGGFFKAPLAWASDDITAYQLGGMKGIAHSNKVLFNYRRNSITISSTGATDLKLKAIEIERIWIEDYLNTNLSMELDELLRINILQYLPRYVSKKRVYTLSKIYSKGFFYGLGWIIKNRRKVNISAMEVIFSIVINTKDRIKY